MSKISLKNILKKTFKSKPKSNMKKIKKAKKVKNIKNKSKSTKTKKVIIVKTRNKYFIREKHTF